MYDDPDTLRSAQIQQHVNRSHLVSISVFGYFRTVDLFRCCHFMDSLSPC